MQEKILIICELIFKAFTDHEHQGEFQTLFGYQFDSHDDLDSSHTQSIYKGLSAFAGIYLFYLIESIMKLRNTNKSKVLLFLRYIYCNKLNICIEQFFKF